MAPLRLFLLLIGLLPLAALAQAPAEPIKISVLPGLKFDRTRFAVAPGAKVQVQFTNPDQMIHNLVITQPDARVEVVTAALALGAEGPAKNFIPDSPKVLWATKALSPGETTELSFTAPAQEGVYPYVCTFMGHGVIMYGAMYVTTKPLPPLAADPNVPPAAVAINDASDFSTRTLERPVVSRTFLPDCGPAALAIGLPGGVSYAFDAGQCRLRYAWKGGFVDNGEHWAGKGDTMAKIVGRVFFRAEGGLHLGTHSRVPQAKWLGYELTKEGTPRLHYWLDGAEVWEEPLVSPATADGPAKLIRAFRIASAEPVQVVFDPEAGAEVTASVGKASRGLISLSPEEARDFTVTLTERPGQEPLKYWSMNDLVFPNKKDPQPGVLGRAFTPGGTDGKPRPFKTDITSTALRHGGTVLAWVKLAPPKVESSKKTPPPPPPPAVVFSTGTLAVTPPWEDERWHHLAVVFEHGTGKMFVDGQAAAPAELALPGEEAELILGSAGDKNYLKGLLDEVRIYDRALSDAEIETLYRREAAALTEGAK